MDGIHWTQSIGHNPFREPRDERWGVVVLFQHDPVFYGGCSNAAVFRVLEVRLLRRETVRVNGECIRMISVHWGSNTAAF